MSYAPVARTMQSRTSQARQQQPPNQEQRMQHCGAYTMIAPNEKKRHEIQQAAQRGEQAYQKHLEQKKQSLPTYNIRAPLGGGQTKPSQSRLVTSEASRKVAERERRDAGRAAKKAREEEEYDRKKADARQQTLTNQQRERAKKSQLDVERRQAWLRKQ